MSQTLSIIVPAYNEGRTVKNIMDALNTRCPEAQVVYVDDGSTDDTLATLRANARPQDTVLTKRNGGKGSAIREGLGSVTGDYTVIQDADLEYDPAEIAMLLTEAKTHPGSAVFGSRFLRKNPMRYWRFLLGTKAVTAVLNILFWSRLTDSYTCYKLLPTPLFRALELASRGFELEAEIASKCLKRGIEIREIPISYRPRTLEEGKKIRFSDAWKGVKMMLKIRLY
jgi:dolichol-phosphate mannosyltransferase